MSEKKEYDELENLDLNSFADKDSVTENKETPKKRPVGLLVAFNVVVSLILAVSLFITGVLGALAYLFRDMQLDVHFSEKPEDLGITEEIIEKLPEESGIVNIALFGIDNKKKFEGNSKRVKGRSDSIIILSIDSNKKTVKLTSILRDSWVPIERTSGTKNYKINTAYAYGGPQLAVKTLNQNFNLNIKDYATVGLYQMATIIDYVGGIDLTITEKERVQINRCAIDNKLVKQVKTAGKVHLTGEQAMGYASIRYIDGDDRRAQRHQKVLAAMLQEVKKKPITEYPALLRKILGQVETSMTFDELINYTALVADSELKLETTIIPGSNIPYKRGVFSDTRGGWVWKYDLEVASDFIHTWIYGEETKEDQNKEETNGSTPSNGSEPSNTDKDKSDNSSNTNSQSEETK